MQRDEQDIALYSRVFFDIQVVDIKSPIPSDIIAYFSILIHQLWKNTWIRIGVYLKRMSLPNGFVKPKTVALLFLPCKSTVMRVCNNIYLSHPARGIHVKRKVYIIRTGELFNSPLSSEFETENENSNDRIKNFKEHKGEVKSREMLEEIESLSLTF